MPVKMGRETRIKFIGGELVVQQWGDDAISLSRKVDDQVRRSANLKPAFDAFHPVWLASEANIFATGGPPAEKWPPLQAAYRLWKVAHGYSDRPLVRTGRLRGSVTEAGHPDAVWQATPKTIRIGTSVPYGVYHQTGRGVPRRRFLFITPNALKALGTIVKRYILTGEARA